MLDFRLSPGLDPQQLAPSLARNGRLQIGNFLVDANARALFDWLAQSREWRLAANRGEEILHFDQATLAAFTPEQWSKLNQAVALGGRYGFQFRYDTIRLPNDDRQEAAALAPLREFADFLSSVPLVDFMRTLTGKADIAFADAHASRYRPGHFLTSHDDASENMARRAAYVLNLTPEWRPDWGGLLLFYDAQGNVVRGYTPGFNTLNIFLVPQAHSVSWVTPLAGQPRYAITGWLRAGEQG